MPATNPFYPLTTLPRTRYYKFPPDWDDVMTSQTFQDGGKSFNLNSTIPPQRWEVVYTGMTEAQAAVFDLHFAEKGYTDYFDFTEKGGTVVTHVYYKSFEKSHDAHKSWIQTRRIELIKYPYTTAAVFF